MDFTKDFIEKTFYNIEMLVGKLKSKKLNGDLITVQLLLSFSIGFCCLSLNNLVVTCLGVFL
jgi:hypothetical protein